MKMFMSLLFNGINNRSPLLIIFPFNIYLTAFCNARRQMESSDSGWRSAVQKNYPVESYSM